VGRSGRGPHAPARPCIPGTRDEHPEKFLDLHEAIFAARHDNDRDLRDPAIVADILSTVGLDDDSIMTAAGDPATLARYRTIHETAANKHRVFGVPTFIVGEAAVFVRLQHRPNGDVNDAISSIERVVELMAWSDLNEFKWTSVRR